jgi:hypothetical protein
VPAWIGLNCRDRNRVALEGELAALARAAGVPVSVAEAPAGPPRGRRPARLVEKVRAGADVAVVDHCGGAGRTAR